MEWTWERKESGAMKRKWGEGALEDSRSTFYRATACNATHGIAVGILSVRLSVRTFVRQMRVL